VADQKPPRLSGDERSTLMALLNYQRQSVIKKVSGLSDEQAKWSPVPSATSALWIVDHLATAEQSWILERFAGGLATPSFAANSHLHDAVSRYLSTHEEVDAVINDHDFDDVCVTPSDLAPVNLRWVLAHLLEETARHAGHLDLIVELLDGRVGR
jgi:uncharacterized damage-inducible protein DinB